MPFLALRPQLSPEGTILPKSSPKLVNKTFTTILSIAVMPTITQAYLLFRMKNLTNCNISTKQDSEPRLPILVKPTEKKYNFPSLCLVLIK